MLYCVSYSNGAVGVFSSLEKVKELIFDRYKSITFIVQVFKQSENIQLVDNRHMAWIIMYSNSETYAYVSDNKDEVTRAQVIFDKIGKIYEGYINIDEQEIDTLSECVENILNSLQGVYESNGFNVDSSDNIIYYV